MATSVVTATVGWTIAIGTDDAVWLPLTALAQLLSCTAVEFGTDKEPVTALPATSRYAVGPVAIDGKPGLVLVGWF